MTDETGQAANAALDEMIARFAARWKQKPQPNIAEFLCDSAGPRQEILGELIKVDLENRWRQLGQNLISDHVHGAEKKLPVSEMRYLEEYITEFPELTLNQKSLLELVGEEYRARHRWGDQPAHDEYLSRYVSVDSQRLCDVLIAIDKELTVDEAKQSLLDVLNPDAPTHTDLRLPSSCPAQESRTRSAGGRNFRSEKSDSETRKQICETKKFDELSRFLRNTHPFEELPQAVNNEIAGRMKERRFAAGATIIRQGEAAEEMLILVEGVAEVSVDDERDQPHIITRVGSHTVLGEIALLTREPRSANVKAVTDIRALALHIDDYHAVAADFPTLNVIFSELVAERVGTSGYDVLCGKTVNRYRVERRLGRGSMGVVYEATDLESGTPVALKMMSHALIYDLQAVNRFHREAEIVDSLDHPHIIRSCAKFTALSTFFIVMEYCDGLPLSQVIALAGRLDEDATRQILGQLAAALAHTHSLGIVHRDLKPGNLFVQWDGCVKLMDFGLARSERNPELTQCGQIVGTPRYMPPEQLAGQTVGREADLFAMGCIGYELLNGNPLFPGGDIIALLHQHLDWSLPAAANLGSGISEELHRLLQLCLMREPNERRVQLSKVAEWASPFDMSICRERIDELTAEATDVPTVFNPEPTQEPNPRPTQVPTSEYWHDRFESQ